MYPFGSCFSPDIHPGIGLQGHTVALRLPQVAPVVKNMPANAGDERDTGLIPGLGPLEKGMATHSSILASRIQRTEEPGGPQSIGLQRVGQH